LGFLVVSPLRIACKFLHWERGRSSKRVGRTHRIIYLFIHVPAVVQLCSQLEVDFEYREMLILVMCTLKHRIPLQTLLSDLESLQIQTSFEMLGRFSPGAMQFPCETTHAVYPQPGHQRAACFANVYYQLSVVQCRYLSCMLTAVVGLHNAHARDLSGSEPRRSPPWRFFTGPAGAAALQMDH
jgi:hypothetical protein